MIWSYINIISFIILLSKILWFLRELNDLLIIITITLIMKFFQSLIAYLIISLIIKKFKQWQINR